MGYVIREATATDLDWINTNDQKWTVHERGDGYGGTSYTLEAAWGVFVACDIDSERLGWTYVVGWDDHVTLQLVYVGKPHRKQGVARALVEDLFSRYPGEIVLGGWDRDLFEMWRKLGFSYIPSEHDHPQMLTGDLIRPALTA